MAWDISSNLSSATVATGGTDAPVSGTVETFVVSNAVDIPPASSVNQTQFRFVDAAQASNSALAEVFSCTNVNGASWTVIRGAESIGNNGASPVAHGANWLAVVVDTAAGNANLLGLQPAKTYPLGNGGSTAVNMPAGYSIYTTGLASSVSTPYILPKAQGGEEYTWVGTNASGTFTLAPPTFTAYSGDSLTWVTNQPDWLAGGSLVNEVLFKAIAAGSVNAYAVTSAAGPALGALDQVQTVTGGTATVVIASPATTTVTRTIINLSAGSVTPIQFPFPEEGMWFENVYVQPSTGAAGSVSLLAPIGWYGGTGNTMPALSTSNGLRDLHRYNCDDGNTWTGRTWTGAPLGSGLISLVNSWDNGFGSSTAPEVAVNPASVGHLLVLAVPIYYYNHSIDDISSVTGGGVTTWHEAGTYATTGSGGQTYYASSMWWGIVTTPGSASITANFGTANGGGLLEVFEFATSVGAFSQDGAGVSASGDNVTSITLPTLTPSGPYELGLLTSYNAETIGVPPGYTLSGFGSFYYNTNVSTPQALTLSATSGNMTAVACLIKV